MLPRPVPRGALALFVAGAEMTFNEHDHARLATLFDGVRAHECPNEFNWGGCKRREPIVPYPGYRPEVREAPNGDTKACPHIRNHGPGGCTACKGSGRVPNVDAEGVCGVCDGEQERWYSADREGYRVRRACDACNGTGRTPAKRYLHVALKYKPPARAEAYLARAHWEACKVAEALGVRKEYFPMAADGTLRVLEYPPGAGSVEHTDFDLFSIVLWRSTPEDLERDLVMPEPSDLRRRFDAERLSPGLHIGELGELVGLGPATPHRVPARPYVQKSIVYFAMPDHAARLQSPDVRATDGLTIGAWLRERMARSRYT